MSNSIDIVLFPGEYHRGPVSLFQDFWLSPPQFWSIFGSSRTKPSFWILKALPPRSPDQVLWRELRSMEALGEIKRK